MFFLTHCAHYPGESKKIKKSHPAIKVVSSSLLMGTSCPPLRTPVGGCSKKKHIHTRVIKYVSCYFFLLLFEREKKHGSCSL
jgi:hypothetical protein